MQPWDTNLIRIAGELRKSLKDDGKDAEEATARALISLHNLLYEDDIVYACRPLPSCHS
jgi:hypothetical protein